MKIEISRRVIDLSTKIALASCIAVFIAQNLGLQNGPSAGTIALLTIVSTKRETLQLSWARIYTYIVSVGIAFVVYRLPFTWWILYGIYIFALVMFSMAIDLRSTISVNSVIGMHFLLQGEFSLSFIWNEMQLVLVGIIVATIINLLPVTKYQKDRLIANMRRMEENMKDILLHLVSYLRNEDPTEEVWKMIHDLENELVDMLSHAREYEANTIKSHTIYFADYLEMRLEQCYVLEHMNKEISRIRSMPEAAEELADLMEEMSRHINEYNPPKETDDRLNEVREKHKEWDLPTTYEELEKCAMISHLLNALEDFAGYKRSFVNRLDEETKAIYWEKKWHK